jgi:hypothetical protein
MGKRAALIEFRCLVCDKNLPSAIADTIHASGGLTFRSGGNYGSRIYDPFRDEGRIVAWVCDECVIERVDRWVLETVKPQKPLVEYVQLASVEDLP